MKLSVVAGARPNFMKVAPLLRALDHDSEVQFVHTGQHYHWHMSESFLKDLEMREPDVNLGVGSGTHAQQTAGVMVAYEALLLRHPVDAVVVVGDVNSTLAAALSARKLMIPVAHVEAGLRSRDPSMPEEVNRQLTDRLSHWLFAPTDDAADNLRGEGVQEESIHVVGNVMIDTLLYSLDQARRRLPEVRRRLRLPGSFGLMTLHRPSNVDDPSRLVLLLEVIGELSTTLPIVFPVHPRTKERLLDVTVHPNIIYIDPLPYLDFVALLSDASLVLTDSGGIQEETSVLGIPCLTLRENTERPLTCTLGTNHVVGSDPSRILAAAHSALGRAWEPGRFPLWDGRTAERIADVLLGELDAEHSNATFEEPIPSPASFRSDITSRVPAASSGDHELAPYVVITPVRNEEAYVEKTIESMLNQTILPAEWILVDDGSDDRTPQILQQYALRVPWLRVVTKPDRGFRESGRGVVDAFNEGYRHLRSQDWGFIVKLDGDLVFEKDYFEQCLRHFVQEPRLGIAGGTVESVRKNGIQPERLPQFHVRGATKIYRRRSWEEIGGLVSAPGWDALDEIKANMLRWQTRTFPDLVLTQLRPTGSAQGQWRDWLKGGEGSYLIGYHPLFLLARSIVRARRSPYLVASTGLLVGYLRAFLRRLPRAADSETVAYVRKQQLARLLGRETIWR